MMKGLGNLISDVASRPELSCFWRTSTGRWILVIAAILLLLLGLFLEDERVPIAHIVPGGGLCATQEDMYDDVRRRCIVGDPFAYAALLDQTWVTCAPNLPAAQLLQKSQGPNGEFFYAISERESVREFYKTCIPTCASSEDTYHFGKKLCMVGNGVAAVWLQGDGQRCGSNTPGGDAIRRTSEVQNDGNFWYKPEATDKVKMFYSTCTATCAAGDTYRGSGGGWFTGERAGDRTCAVRNSKALAFLRGDQLHAVCDNQSPGKAAVRAARDGVSFWYFANKGDEVEAWYTSCRTRRGDAGQVDADSSSSAPDTVAPDGKLHFPVMYYRYPRTASEDTPTVCNFSGKTYWFSARDTQPKDISTGRGNGFLHPMKQGSSCTTIPNVSCKDVGGKRKYCGFVAPCTSSKCDTSAAVGVEGGINIINGKGQIEWLPAH